MLRAHSVSLIASASRSAWPSSGPATRPVSIAIGERCRPDPHGRPGFLRVDTVHQGDWDGAKGVYDINAVDAVTQCQVVGCASKISEIHWSRWRPSWVTQISGQSCATFTFLVNIAGRR